MKDREKRIMDILNGALGPVPPRLIHKGLLKSEAGLNYHTFYQTLYRMMGKGMVHSVDNDGYVPAGSVSERMIADCSEPTTREELWKKAYKFGRTGK